MLSFTLTRNNLPFKDLYKEIIIRNPKKGRLFRAKVGLRVKGSALSASGLPIVSIVVPFLGYLLGS